MEEAKKEDSEKLKENSLKCSIKDGTAYAIMDSTGNSYITPFAVALNASTGYVGILASLPNLIASLLQLKTVRLMEKEKRKEIVSKSTLWQAIMWLPIAVLAFFPSKFSLALLIIFYTILISANAFIVPVWNSWMKDLVQKCSGRFFSNRSKINGIAGLIAMLLAGYLLDIFKKWNMISLGFFAIFTTAFFARMISRNYLNKQYEPKFELHKGYYFSFIDFLKKIRATNFGRFVIFVSLFNFAVYVASPFFTVYMLRDLQFSYSQFMIINIMQSIATLITLPFWGKFADKYGNLKSLQISSLLIPLVPALWLLSNNFYYLVAVQIFAGFIWASFNLSASNFIFDAVSRERMGLCVAYSGILSTLGLFIGSSVGGFIASVIKTNMSPILVIFIISAVLRLAVPMAMLPKIKEVRIVRQFSVREKLMMFLPLQNHQLFSQNFNHHKK